MPLIFYDTSSNEIWNSDNVSGGVVATVRSYAAADTDVLTFPAFAGRTATLINLLQWPAPGDPGVTLDTALGYPRVTVAAASNMRRIALVIT